MKTAATTRQETLRTQVLMDVMSCRIGAPSVQKFASVYDASFPEMRGTQGSNKWRGYFGGKKGKRPLKPEVLKNFCELWPEADQFYRDGPAELWVAMWGDESKLWRLCRTRYVSNGPDYDDRVWLAIEDKFRNEIGFGDALREFEGSLLLAEAYNYPLSIRYLTEAICFYRLYLFLNEYAHLDVDGRGAYRSVRMCLDNRGVRWALDALTFGNLKIYELLVKELEEIEMYRLINLRSYRQAIGFIDFSSYVARPQEVISTNERWKALDFDWVSQ